MGHLTPSRDHLWMCLDAVTLTGPSLTAGAVLAGRSRKSGDPPLFPGELKKEAVASLCLSLCVSDKRAQQNKGSHMSD
jgi:hypothetical protein